MTLDVEQPGAGAEPRRGIDDARSSRGIAIVEDKYVPELNPNVAMEWGWMRALKRSVLFLREESFDHARADWDGLIDYRFKWDDPKPGIDVALDKFLGPTQ